MRPPKRPGRYRVPYLRLFPIWRFGLYYPDPLSGRAEDGWYPDRFGYKDFPTQQEADAFVRAYEGRP